MERDIRREAQRVTLDSHFSPQALLENTPEAFATWLVTYFPHKIPSVEDWQMEPLEAMVSQPRALILVPAGTMKTTIGAELKTIWRICQCADYEILGVFKNDMEAKKSLKACKWEMMFNEKLIADYGPFMPAGQQTRSHKWTEHEVDVIKRKRRGKQHSLMFYPYGGQVLGNRFHQGFCDDVVTRDIAYSPEQVRQTMDWLSVDFETGPYAPDSPVDWTGGMIEQVHVYGTRMTPHDTYAKIEERNAKGDPDNPNFRPYQVICIDIIKDEAKQETISERWSWSKLMAKKDELQEPAFSMRMRNIPLNPETMVFKEVWLRGGEMNGVSYPGCRDKTRTFGEVEAGDIVTIGYDPQSGSTTRFAKDAAVVCMANQPSDVGNWSPRLVDWWKGQTPIIDMKRKDSQLWVIVEMGRVVNRKNIVPTVVLESNNVQRGLKEPLEQLAHDQGVQLTVYISPTGANKYDDATGIEACAKDFQNGWMVVPFAQPADEAKAIGFENCMLEYGTSKYYDVPIAYWKARGFLYEQRFTARMRPAVLVKKLPRYMQRHYRRMGISETVTVLNGHALPPVREETMLE
jgi:hypothetical protein